VRSASCAPQCTPRPASSSTTPSSRHGPRTRSARRALRTSRRARWWWRRGGRGPAGSSEGAAADRRRRPPRKTSGRQGAAAKEERERRAVASTWPVVAKVPAERLVRLTEPVVPFRCVHIDSGVSPAEAPRMRGRGRGGSGGGWGRGTCSGAHTCVDLGSRHPQKSPPCCPLLTSPHSGRTLFSLQQHARCVP